MKRRHAKESADGLVLMTSSVTSSYSADGLVLMTSSTKSSYSADDLREQSCYLEIAIAKRCRLHKLIRQRFALALKIQQMLFALRFSSRKIPAGSICLIPAGQPDASNSSIQSRAFMNQLLLYIQSQATVDPVASFSVIVYPVDLMKRRRAGESADGLALMTSSVTSSQSADGLREQSQESVAIAKRCRLHKLIRQRFALALKIQQMLFCVEIQQRKIPAGSICLIPAGQPDARNSSIQSRAFMNQLLLYIQSQATVDPVASFSVIVYPFDLEFPPLKILTAKTISMYIAINNKIAVEDVEDEPRVKKTPIKKAVSRKRPAVAVVELVVNRKRTLVGKAADVAKDSALVTVAQEAVPLQIVAPILMCLLRQNAEPRRGTAYFVEEPIEETEKNQGTEISDVFQATYEESMSLDELLATIPHGSVLPSTAGEITKIQFGRSITIRGVNEGDWYKASLPKIRAADKGKAPLHERDPIKGHPALDWAVKMRIRPPEFETSICDVKYHVSLSDLIVDRDYDGATVMDLKPISEEFISSEQPVLGTSDSVEHTAQAPLVQGDTNLIADSVEPIAQVTHLETAFADAFTQQDQTFRGALKSVRPDVRNEINVLSIQLNEFKKSVRTQGVLLTTDVADVRKEVKEQKAELIKELDERLATIRSDSLDFRAQAQENHLSLSTQLGYLIDYINRGGDAKKGESGSSRLQPPPDDKDRGSAGSRGDRSGSSRKRYFISGGGPQRRSSEYWFGGK
ncbi:acetyl-coenzyme A carboxylase carboxyl transferase subunit alpha, chloroplastic [Dorcoceras hygrometricum]|uniref:Acetyl-coenzyme A carboxylase carboxyl transferase subunit alpha, chloroplastic n=1 Tax=Dorcoceras hygrometricum TaxID=472368 RepID=A0A2Z7BVG5_9LAMI|nr:acetyl-coenzyme A carboxylase carboxyl transferase subunit alpha, chloroplastic [Dorcoceras hygrometricum]